MGNHCRPDCEPGSADALLPSMSEVIWCQSGTDGKVLQGGDWECIDILVLVNIIIISDDFADAKSSVIEWVRMLEVLVRRSSHAVTIYTSVQLANHSLFAEIT